MSALLWRCYYREALPSDQDCAWKDSLQKQPKGKGDG